MRLVGLVLFGLAVLAGCSPQVPSSEEGANPVADSIVPRTEVRTDDEYFGSSVRTVCAERYSEDMMMRGACARNARQGRSDFLAIAAEFAGNREMEAGLAHCFDRYTEAGATNFMMLGACARNQRAGYIDYTAQ